MNTELALKINKYIHEQCIDGVPHDIGWNVMKIINEEMTSPKVFKSSKNQFVSDVFCECGDQMTVDEINNNQCSNCENNLNL
jgi:hypothetical protein